MYAGADKDPGTDALQGWLAFTPQQQQERSVFAIKQDVKLLNANIVRATLAEPLEALVKKHGLKAEDIDWFLPHISSMYFYEPVMQALADIGLPIPRERWFTNLTRKGNTGSAAPYIMLDELFQSGRIQRRPEDSDVHPRERAVLQWFCFHGGLLMELKEVPQERNTTLDGQRKVVYAKDAQGRLRIATSQGWEVEEIVTTQALTSLQSLATEALEQVRLGQASSLAYWMHERRMDEALLAQSTGFLALARSPPPEAAAFRQPERMPTLSAMRRPWACLLPP